MISEKADIIQCLLIDLEQIVVHLNEYTANCVIH